MPPVTEISERSKSVDGSLKEKEIAGVSLSPKLVLLELMLMVGTNVSMTKYTRLLGSAPSSLALPAASENLKFSTHTDPCAVLFG